MQADWEISYAYYGNIAVDLDSLPVNRARLTVVQPALFEWDVFEMAAPIQSPAKCEVRFVIRFQFNWDILDHPPYSPDLGPSDFHLFIHLKKHLTGQKFDDDDEVQEEVMTRFKVQAADFYNLGIQKLVPRLNKCLENAGEYVEK